MRFDDPPRPPQGFEIGHWSDHRAETGCTVILAPAGSCGGVDVRGGGPGSRETEIVSPLANAEVVNGLVFSGGSAFGLAAADGVVRWLAERGRGYETPGGVVPLVPAAVVYDLLAGEGAVRPGPEAGYGACEAARPGTPDRGRIGAGSGTAAAKGLGRERAVPAGVGFAAGSVGSGWLVAALAVVNPSGDVFEADGRALAVPRGEDGAGVRTADLIAAATEPPRYHRGGLDQGSNTTLVCILTDAPLGKLGAAKVARMASAGIARAVDPAFTPVDGDICFCLAPSAGAPVGKAAGWMVMQIGAVAAACCAEAIRDGVRAAR